MTPTPEEVARVEVERLRAGILRHREEVWGSGEIGHPEDAALYELVSEPTHDQA